MYRKYCKKDAQIAAPINCLPAPVRASTLDGLRGRFAGPMKAQRGATWQRELILVVGQQRVALLGRIIPERPFDHLQGTGTKNIRCILGGSTGTL